VLAREGMTRLTKEVVVRVDERVAEANLTSLKQGTKSPTPLSNSRHSNQFNRTAVDEENPIANNSRQ
jgi:hypothetical protein